MPLTSVTAPSNIFSSPHGFPKPNPLHKQHHGTFTFNPSSKFTSLSPKSTSSTSIKASTLLYKQPEIDCNTEICRFCEVGNLQNAMSVLCNSNPTSEIELKTYQSILQLCAEKKSLEDGKKVHSIIQSSLLLTMP
ncbi:hypothetical protein ACHQM5_002758 [Ranunculus cassubicifolius]